MRAQFFEGLSSHDLEITLDDYDGPEWRIAAAGNTGGRDRWWVILEKTVGPEVEEFALGSVCVLKPDAYLANRVWITRRDDAHPLIVIGRHSNGAVLVWDAVEQTDLSVRPSMIRRVGP